MTSTNVIWGSYLGRDCNSTDFESLEDERLTSGVTYTCPEVLTYKKKTYPVLEILLEGNHVDKQL